MGALMTPKELREHVGMTKTTFFAHQRRGAFDRLRAGRPVGRKVYRADLVLKRFPISERRAS